MTLEQFGVEARVIGIQAGPIITRYELKPAPGIKVSKILALTDELAMALEALRVRIEAPIQEGVPLVLKFQISRDLLSY